MGEFSKAGVGGRELLQRERRLPGLSAQMVRMHDQVLPLLDDAGKPVNRAARRALRIAARKEAHRV